MGHKPGSKDKKPCTRRPATVAEKEQPAKKKQKQSHSDHQRAKANFFTRMARPSPQDQGDGTGTSPNQNEPETHFEEINAQDCFFVFVFFSHEKQVRTFLNKKCIFCSPSIMHGTQIDILP
jgi:hypothetical protein